jgi:hypothetical protein
MATIDAIYTSMKRFNNAAAPGSECNAWQDFVAESYNRLGFAPWADEHWQDELPDEFATYWQEVANGECSDYAADTGARLTD